MMNMTDPAPRCASITGRRIIEIVAAHCDVTVDDMKGHRRFPHLVNARHIAAALIRKHRPDLSLPQIGRMLGGRDHSTIIHGQKVLGERIRRNPDLAEAAHDAEMDLVYEALTGRRAGQYSNRVLPASVTALPTAFKIAA